MKTLKIYDPAMCCSTGVCGPEVDPELVAFATYLKKAEAAGVNVERYNLAQEPMAFTLNATVSKLMVNQGIAALPVVIIDDEVVSTGAYPATAVFDNLLGLTP